VVIQLLPVQYVNIDTRMASLRIVTMTTSTLYDVLYCKAMV
jgi:hypothetical protein